MTSPTIRELLLSDDGSLVDEVTGGGSSSDGKDPLAVELGRRGGRKGGRARAKSLSPERRREIARKAAEARWSKSAKVHNPRETSESLNVTAANHHYTLRLRGEDIDCFRIKNGELVFSASSVARLYGMRNFAELRTEIERLNDAQRGEVRFSTPDGPRPVWGLLLRAVWAICINRIDDALACRDKSGLCRGRQALSLPWMLQKPPLRR